MIGKLPKSTFRLARSQWRVFAMLTPAILCYVLFAYLPMVGIVSAFQNYSPFKGFRSDFVGLEWFRKLFSSPEVLRVILYTLTMSMLKIVIAFFPPILIALMLNELSATRFKRVVQTISYLPHFLSWVIVAVLVYRVLDVSDGVVNNLRAALGMERLLFMVDAKNFIPVVIISDIWKEAGWNTIFYLAALTSIDMALYDAAAVDGAGKLRQLIHVTLPGIMPTAIMLMILNVGGMVNANFDQVYNLQNPLIISDTEVINTFIYRKAMLNAQYSFSSAFGLAQGIVSFVLVFGADRLSKKVTSVGIY